MNELKCNTQYIGRQYVWLEKTDSTNNMLKRLISDNTTVEEQYAYGNLVECEPKDGMMIIADHQEAGKGRTGRSWESPAGTSLAISVLLRPQISDDSISMVTLIAALAVSEAVRKVCDIVPDIKWPNDIVINGRKVCGILTELDITDGVKSLIVGVGINVNQNLFPEEIADKATSIMNEAGRLIDREELMQHFAEALEYYYEKFLKTGDMSGLLDEYNGKLINMNREVKVLDPSENIEGIARGIDSMGKLLVETEDGEIHHIYAGEVSVRGLYGYV